MAALTLCACGARSTLNVDDNPPATLGSGGGGGGGRPSVPTCDHNTSWGDTLGSEADLESADGLAVSARCVTYIAGDLSSELFLRAYDDSGTIHLDQRWGDGEGELIRGIGVDGSDNIIIGAQVWGSIDFGGGPLSSVENWDMVLVSLQPDGTHRWSKTFGGRDYQELSDVAVDGEGNIVLAGEAGGPLDFGGGVLSPSGSFDIALARFAPDGEHLASRLVGDDDIQLGPKLASADNGLVYAAGFFSGEVDFGDAPYVSDGDDSYLVLLDDELALRTGLHISGSGSQRAAAVATATDGAIVVGHFTQVVVASGIGFVARGERDVFALGMTSDGNLAWMTTFGGAGGRAWADSVAVAPDGAVWIAGTFEGTLELGETTLKGDPAHFVLRLTEDGVLVDFDVRGGSAIRGGTQIAAMPNGGYTLAGALELSLNFGSTLLQSAGGSDAFVARFRYTR